MLTRLKTLASLNTQNKPLTHFPKTPSFLKVTKQNGLFSPFSLLIGLTTSSTSPNLEKYAKLMVEY